MVIKSSIFSIWRSNFAKNRVRTLLHGHVDVCISLMFNILQEYIVNYFKIWHKAYARSIKNWMIFPDFLKMFSRSAIIFIGFHKICLFVNQNNKKTFIFYFIFKQNKNQQSSTIKYNNYTHLDKLRCRQRYFCWKTRFLCIYLD